MSMFMSMRVSYLPYIIQWKWGKGWGGEWMDICQDWQSLHAYHNSHKREYMKGELGGCETLWNQSIKMKKRGCRRRKSQEWESSNRYSLCVDTKSIFWGWVSVLSPDCPFCGCRHKEPIPNPPPLESRFPYCRGKRENEFGRNPPPHTIRLHRNHRGREMCGEVRFLTYVSIKTKKGLLIW